ncbi:oxidoreductase NAD-binding domain-containing protein 1 [Colletotrichum higginsianum]|uniref:Oxidoreductase NAD-binding domain-containing protein 1 n=1 Tax=Colletotrichum higginsianum (strain IMI 349063) TaxID=759273 RepID=H1W317_COLHI|nr:oxidoreductase NAD-binding domain-containing protein 1 [Colletotrichum higginsianum]
MERTAAEPRHPSLHVVTVSRIDQVNQDIRLFRLGIREGSSIKVTPDRPVLLINHGQWLDTFVPGVTKPGGFTITSPPSKASLPSSAYLELAVQKSPSNPPAAWLWEQPIDQIDHGGRAHSTEKESAQLHVRVGGSFVWPPQKTDLVSPRRVVFIAGGLGINPLMSILSHLADGGECPYDVQFLYSTKTPAEGLNSEKILFLERLAAAYGQGMVSGQLRLFLTSSPQDTSGSISRELLCNGVEMPFMRRRMALEDVAEALGLKEVHGSAVVLFRKHPRARLKDELLPMTASRPTCILRC